MPNPDEPNAQAFSADDEFGRIALTEELIDGLERYGAQDCAAIAAGVVLRSSWLRDRDEAPFGTKDPVVAKVLVDMEALRTIAADSWDEGYVRGVRDEASELEPADNPYRNPGDWQRGEG